MIRLKLTLLALLVVTSLTRDAQSLEITVENISKHWEFYDVINDEKSEEEIIELKEMLESSFLQFNKDMTFTFGFILELNGTWTLRNIIISTEDKRGKNTWTIHNLEEDYIT